jgi:hemoglobin-like flavoprotein
MIMLVTHSLDNLGMLVVTLEELGAAHARFGVRDEHYEHVETALLGALSVSVRAWSAEDHDAWTTLYGYLADLMITGAREAMPRAG